MMSSRHVHLFQIKMTSETEFIKVEVGMKVKSELAEENLIDV